MRSSRSPAWAERRVRGVPGIRLQGRSSLRAGGEQHRALLHAHRHSQTTAEASKPPASTLRIGAREEGPNLSRKARAGATRAGNSTRQ